MSNVVVAVVAVLLLSLRISISTNIKHCKTLDLCVWPWSKLSVHLDNLFCKSSLITLIWQESILERFILEHCTRRVRECPIQLDDD